MKRFPPCLLLLFFAALCLNAVDLQILVHTAEGRLFKWCVSKSIYTLAIKINALKMSDSYDHCFVNSSQFSQSKYSLLIALEIK